MARNYTREQQRRYKSERMKQAAQAARVADRLMGRKPFDWNAPIDHTHDDFIDALKYRWQHNLQVPSPRSNIFIGGITC